MLQNKLHVFCCPLFRTVTYNQESVRRVMLLETEKLLGYIGKCRTIICDNYCNLIFQLITLNVSNIILKLVGTNVKNEVFEKGRFLAFFLPFSFLLTKYQFLCVYMLKLFLFLHGILRSVSL